jgi:hypothetical protein
VDARRFAAEITHLARFKLWIVQPMNNHYNNHGVTLLAIALLIDALNPSPRVAKSKAAVLDSLMLANRKAGPRRS